MSCRICVLCPKLKPGVELLCCGGWPNAPLNRLLVCFAGVCWSVFVALLNKFDVMPLVLTALKRLLLAFGVSSVTRRAVIALLVEGKHIGFGGLAALVLREHATLDSARSGGI